MTLRSASRFEQLSVGLEQGLVSNSDAYQGREGKYMGERLGLQNQEDGEPPWSMSLTSRPGYY